MSSTQSISGGVLPWEVPTQKTAGNPHSCCWGKWRVGRKQRSCTYGMFSTNFKCGQITVLSKYDSSSWKMRKATVAKGQMHCEKYHKSDKKPQGLCSNLFNLSSHCRRSYKTSPADYLTAVTLFFVTLCSLPANAVLETASVKNLDIRFFFAWPHPFLLAYHRSHNTLIPASWEWSCFFVLVHGKERCSAPELQFVILLWYEN